jgi:hypothetical protein
VKCSTVTWSVRADAKVVRLRVAASRVVRKMAVFQRRGMGGPPLRDDVGRRGLVEGGGGGARAPRAMVGCFPKVREPDELLIFAKCPLRDIPGTA